MSKRFLCALALVVFGPIFASSEIVERVVAIVNNDAILESDFTELKNKFKNPVFLIKYLVPENPSKLLSGGRQESLDYLIGEKILESEIRRLGLTATSDKVEQEIRDLARRNNIALDDLYAQIRKEGLSKAEYQDFMKGNIERESLIQQEVISKIRITEEDALADYLRKFPDARVSVDEFTVAHIFFSPTKSGGAEGALKRAEETLQRLRSGDRFETLAEQRSEDPNFTSGGLLGTFKSGEFLREIESAIANLSPGQTSGVVRSRSGFHIVKLLNKKVSSDPRFEREKAGIRARLMEQAAQRQFRIWLESKRDDAFIRINK